MQILHDLTYGLMLFCALLASLIVIERFIFIAKNLNRSRQFVKLSKNHQLSLLNDIYQNDLISCFVKSVEELYQNKYSVDAIQSKSDAYFIDTRNELVKKLWMVDTIVTAAPLLGLLGTIFGIVDTFLALSSSGMSDPSKVSEGIGTALYSTAIGISLALFCLIANNFFNARNEEILENIKFYLLHRED
jgi:biopolymer transport protein ExbB